MDNYDRCFWATVFLFLVTSIFITCLILENQVNYTDICFENSEGDAHFLEKCLELTEKFYDENNENRTD